MLSYVLPAFLAWLSLNSYICTSAKPTAGCRDPSDAFTPDFNAERNITSDGRNRTYLINIPSRFKPNGPDGAPVIFAFHGARWDPATHQELTHFSNETYNPNAVVVYPAAADYWQGSSKAPKGVNDTLFVLDMIDYLSSALCLDDERFYATGMSIGGAFTNVLACSPETNSLFAAFAPVSAAMNVKVNVPGHGGPCNPMRKGRATPILELHGDSDASVPFEGCKQGTCPPILEWLHGWAERNGCEEEGPNEAVLYNGGVVRTSYPCKVYQFKMRGIEHNWATNVSYEVPPGQLSSISATRTIMHFFQLNDKLNAPSGAPFGESPEGHGPAPAPDDSLAYMSAATSSTASGLATATSSSSASAAPSFAPGGSGPVDELLGGSSPAIVSGYTHSQSQPSDYAADSVSGSPLQPGADSASDAAGAIGPVAVGCGGFHRVLKSVVSVNGEDCSPLAWRDLDPFATATFFFLFLGCTFALLYFFVDVDLLRSCRRRLRSGRVRPVSSMRFD